MEQKFYTFLVFPGARGKVRKVRLPYSFLYLLLAFNIVGVATIVALAKSYTRMLLKVANYNRLRSEREALKKQYRTLENVVKQTNEKLGSLESLATEVVLTYGLGQAGRPRLPQAMLNLEAENGSILESSYPASLYTFNVMNRAALNPRFYLSNLSLSSDSHVDRSVVPSIWPVQGQITAGFGQRLDPLSGEGAFHAGLDISAPLGARVDAAADGIVLVAHREAGYGNEIMIDHGYGIATKYCHLSKISVVVGQDVKRGQIIGSVGVTGKTTGPHLHYEVLVHETPVNPAKYLRG